MKTARVEVLGQSAASPEAVWRIARDFAGPWHPAIATIRAERDAQGALVRAFTVEGEDTLYRERLTFFSDSDRTLAYTHLEGISGAEAYDARFSVEAGENSGSTIRWTATVTAPEARIEPIRAGTKAVFEMGIEALGRLAETGRPLEASPDDPILAPVSETIYVDGGPRLALTVSLAVDTGDATTSLFSPSGRSAERMRGDEGAPGHDDGASRTPSSGPTGHYRGEPPVSPVLRTPDGEKREQEACSAQDSAGDGSTTLCLFLHGIGGARGNWLPQVKAAGGVMHAAALDLRGYGGSALGGAPSTVDDYCNDILRVRDALGADRLVLVGLSYGAWIATSFAMRHPGLLAGLVLSGGCTGMSEAGIEERERFRESRRVPLDAGQTPADFAPSVVKVLAGPNASEAVREQLLASMAAIPSPTYRDALDCFTDPPERFDFSRLAMPVLMMTGEYDRLAPPAEIRGVADRIHALSPAPDIRYEVIADAGHVCNVEQPGTYNRILLDFLGRLPR